MTENTAPIEAAEGIQRARGSERVKPSDEGPRASGDRRPISRANPTGALQASGQASTFAAFARVIAIPKRQQKNLLETAAYARISLIRILVRFFVQPLDTGSRKFLASRRRRPWVRSNLAKRRRAFDVTDYPRLRVTMS